MTAVARLAEDGVARKVAMPVPKPETPLEMGRPVPLAKVIVGAVPNTNEPVPVSSEMTPRSWAEVVAPKILRLLVTVPGKVKVVAMDRVGVVVEPSETIWLAVPRTEVTVPLPPAAAKQLAPVEVMHFICAETVSK